MTVAESPGRSDEAAKGALTLLIDTDVHETMKGGPSALLPYLDPAWHRYVTGVGGDWQGLGLIGSYAKPVATNAARQDWNLDDGTAGTDPEAMLRHLMDDENTSIAILNGSFPVSRVDHDYEFMQALATAYNSWQIDVWLERDPRICGSVHVIAHDPVAAAREIDRVAEHPQIVQVFLPTVTNRQYGDPFYRPIFEAAVRNNLALAMHHHGGHTETVLGYPRNFIEWHTTAAPHANQCQIVSMICNGTFEKFPELKVVALETGVAWVPWLMWRLDQQYRELRANVPWLKRLPSEHIRDNVRVSTQPITDITAKQFEQLTEMSESESVFVFSSDYPHWDADSAGSKVLDKLSPEFRNRVRYENALETYPRLAKLVGTSE
jgi:predicted TIM-barrel fold metal-dependent hydrolase